MTFSDFPDSVPMSTDEPASIESDFVAWLDSNTPGWRAAAAAAKQPQRGDTGP